VKDKPWTVELSRRIFGSVHLNMRCAIKLHQVLNERRDGTCWILGKQYLRSATSIGVNIEEAQSGETRADFIHRYGIAQKEAKESLYWLRPLAESEIVPVSRLKPLMRETEELFAVITAIILKARKNRGQPRS
jgi:four helix bundle protein